MLIFIFTRDTSIIRSTSMPGSTCWPHPVCISTAMMTDNAVNNCFFILNTF